MAVVLDLSGSKVRGHGGVAKPSRGWLRRWIALAQWRWQSVVSVPRLVASVQVTGTGGAVATWSEWTSRGDRPGYCVNLLTFPGPDEALEWIEGCAQGRDFAWSERLLDQRLAVLNNQDIGWFMRRSGRTRGAIRPAAHPA